MTVDLAGQVAVITGAGGGLGRAYAILLGARGAHVVVNDIGGDVSGHGGSKGPAEAVAEAIVADGGRATASDDDISTAAGAARLVETTIARHGQIDTLIHNAGIQRDAAVADVTADDLSATLSVHLGAAYHLLKPALPAMRERGFGRIVLTSSGAGLLRGYPLQATYSAAKTGLVGLMRVLNCDNGDADIRANIVVPIARTRMSRLGADPASVAALIGWLVSRGCTISNEMLLADGVRIARVFIGQTQGWPMGDMPTPEDVAANFDRVMSLEGYSIPSALQLIPQH